MITTLFLLRNRFKRHYTLSWSIAMTTTLPFRIKKKIKRIYKIKLQLDIYYKLQLDIYYKLQLDIYYKLQSDIYYKLQLDIYYIFHIIYNVMKEYLTAG